MATITSVERLRLWRLANPDKVRAQRERRRARLLLRPAKRTAQQRAANRRRLRAWRAAHPDRVAEQRARHQTKRTAARAIPPSAACAVCQAPARVRDLARGGALCRRCTLAVRSCGTAERAVAVAEYLMLA